MRLHFDFSEYEHDEDSTNVMLTVTLPDGSPHSRVTEVYEKAVSLLYGYDIGAGADATLKRVLEAAEEADRGCQDCVQGTCVFNCGSEFK